MSLNKVPSGQNLPDDFNVIIEIPMHGEPVKYEVDKESGAIFVDRYMDTAMLYLCNYGYIPLHAARMIHIEDNKQFPLPTKLK